MPAGRDKFGGAGQGVEFRACSVRGPEALTGSGERGKVSGVPLTSYYDHGNMTIVIIRGGIYGAQSI
jgi:hypothetical protein